MRFIDLFSGCGGLSQGFVDASWRPVFGVEILSAPAKSYAANFKVPVWSGKIEDFCAALEEGTVTLPPVDAVIGGPPCQGHSPLGKMSAQENRKEKHSDLNGLWRYFLRVVEIFQPEFILTENVPEVMKHQEFVEYETALRQLGYKLDIEVLKSEKFGVPQKRKRAFCVGSRNFDVTLPKPTGELVTVRDAIGHIPLKPDEKNWHIGRNPTPVSLERYKVIPEGGNRFDLMRERPDITPRCWLEKKTGTTDVFGRLKWDEPASTIRTEFFKPEKGRYLHPTAHRPITHREAAALQTFPSDFIFKGSKIEVARQIGEAVPPKLSKEIALQILRCNEAPEEENQTNSKVLISTVAAAE